MRENWCQTPRTQHFVRCPRLTNCELKSSTSVVEPERWHLELNDHIRGGKALQHGAKKKHATFLWCASEGHGEILGYACISRRNFDKNPAIPSLLITELALDQRHQNRGHGTKMLKELKRFGTSGGAKVIELFVHERNVQAMGLYEKQGFKPLPGLVYVDPDTGDRYPEMICIL